MAKAACSSPILKRGDSAEAHLISHGQARRADLAGGLEIGQSSRLTPTAGRPLSFRPGCGRPYSRIGPTEFEAELVRNPLDFAAHLYLASCSKSIEIHVEWCTSSWPPASSRDPGVRFSRHDLRARGRPNELSPCSKPSSRIPAFRGPHAGDRLYRLEASQTATGSAPRRRAEQGNPG